MTKVGNSQFQYIFFLSFSFGFKLYILVISCRKYFDLTDFAQLTFRSQKNGFKRKKNLMPHWIFQKVLMRNKFVIWNGLIPQVFSGTEGVRSSHFHCTNRPFVFYIFTLSKPCRIILMIYSKWQVFNYHLQKCLYFVELMFVNRQHQCPLFYRINVFIVFMFKFE